MKERPMLFSAPMVRAILAGTKTQTRRVVKTKDLQWLDNSVSNFFDGKWNQRPLPYGQPGDRLWVRENWRIGAWDEDEAAFAIDYCDGPRREWLKDPQDIDGSRFNDLWEGCSAELLRIDIYPDKWGRHQWAPGESPLRWRTSIHMPRWASRITLEITAMRVERLNDIAVEDAEAEGCKAADSLVFKTLWESINGPGSWAENPWVWVVEFQRLAG